MLTIVRDISDKMFPANLGFCKRHMTVSGLRNLIDTPGTLISVQRGDEAVLDVLDRRCGITVPVSEFINRRDTMLGPGGEIVAVQHLGDFDTTKEADEMVHISAYRVSRN